MRYILLLLMLIFGGIYMLFFKARPTSPTTVKASVPHVISTSTASQSNFLKAPLDRTQAALDQARANVRENKF